MILLVGFSFLAGVVTILSPCILPILPIVLSGALSGGKWRPLGVVTGFILSFTFFMTFSFTIAQALGFSTEILRNVAVVLLLIFGFALFIPQLQTWMERFVSRFTPSGQQKREGFLGGVVLGVSLGFIWTPCVGPILASVITLAATSQVTSQVILIAFAFSIGTAIPMLAIAYGGNRVLNTLPALKKRSEMIQKIFGVLIIATAIMIFFNIDRKFQEYILTTFPEYGAGLTQFEDNEAVQEQLQKLEEDAGDMDSGLMNLREQLDKMQSVPAPNPDFEGGTNWLNSEPLSLNYELDNNVVLVDFWTYTCINCIRTFPHLRAWYDNYKDDGFVIVGVHTPEFEFEKKTENVKQALEDHNLTYPVVQDNNYKIWRSYNNRYWPAHYLIDRDGNIRYTHFGEGQYEKTEEMIRTLLAEKGTLSAEDIEMEDKTPQHRRTPESYLGYGRIDRFVSPENIAKNEPKEYSLTPGLPLHGLAYGGTWTVGEEHALSSQGSEIEIHFEAQEVFLVMRSEGEGRVEVYLDDQLVTEEQAGEDVEDGIVEVMKDRLYRLIELDDVEDHYLRLKFVGDPIEVFAFTFG